jgi:hypothetical protein
MAKSHVRSALIIVPRQASRTALASDSVSNQCRFKHSSRSDPLKVSMKALSSPLPNRSDHSFCKSFIRANFERFKSR